MQLFTEDERLRDKRACCPGCGRPVSECQAEDVDESFPAVSRTELWLGRARWFRHNVLYPLVILSAVIWLVRQVTA